MRDPKDAIDRFAATSWFAAQANFRALTRVINGVEYSRPDLEITPVLLAAIRTNGIVSRVISYIGEDDYDDLRAIVARAVKDLEEGSK